MRSPQQETDRRVTAYDMYLSRAMPDLKNTGLTDSGFWELVGDPDRNRQALIDIVKEYEDYFYSEDGMDPLVDSVEKPSMDHPDFLWSDGNILRELVNGTKMLLDGIISANSLYRAQTLATAYRVNIQRDLDLTLKIMNLAEEEILYFRQKVAQLSDEKKEVETLEEIDSYLSIIIQSETVSQVKRRKLRDCLDKLKTSIQAGAYVTGILINDRSN